VIDPLFVAILVINIDRIYDRINVIILYSLKIIEIRENLSRSQGGFILFLRGIQSIFLLKTPERLSSSGVF
jgi:hypothetical protein